MARLPPEKVEGNEAIHEQLNREGVDASVDEAVAAMLYNCHSPPTSPEPSKLALRGRNLGH
eukprot:m.161807 g.161807  ORF g.161807 m.161807 type:complete len:61 (+) comp38822_c0_seq35:1055-1237(+)